MTRHTATIRFHKNDMFEISAILAEWKKQISKLSVIEYEKECAKLISHHIDTCVLDDMPIPQNVSDKIDHFEILNRTSKNFNVRLHMCGQVSNVIYIPNINEIYGTIISDSKDWIDLFLKKYRSSVTNINIDNYAYSSNDYVNSFSNELFQEIAYNKRENVRRIIEDRELPEIDINCSAQNIKYRNIDSIMEAIPSRYERALHQAIYAFNKMPPISKTIYSPIGNIVRTEYKKPDEKDMELEAMRIIMLLPEITKDMF